MIIYAIVQIVDTPGGAGDPDIPALALATKKGHVFDLGIPHPLFRTRKSAEQYMEKNVRFSSSCTVMSVTLEDK